MLFNSNIFLFAFLPVTLIGYYILPKRFKNALLLIVSLVFYAWGEPMFVFVMMGAIVLNYLLAILVEFYRDRDNIKLSKTLLILCIIGNLGLFFVYKYLDFAIVNINRLGFDIPLQHIMLPIGISFFLFQAMSYVIDVSRGSVTAEKSILNVGLYIASFPQLMAGPIIRYKDIAEQIKQRVTTIELFSEGVRRFLIGFSKKMLLANSMALIADHAFALQDAERSVIYAWIGVIAYAFQIFFDFAGYSDMAIGLGRMFGFTFLENFNYPYISKSISEFWRRWHISLGNWFRDYVYFPLGGSRVDKKSRIVFNLFIVWLLTGVWHGASWNFIFWGLFYFVLIAFEKVTGYPGKFSSSPAKVLYRVFTLLCVLAGWVMFRAPGMSAALGYGASMFGLTGNSVACDYVIMTFREYWVFLVFCVLCSTEVFKRLRERVDSLSGVVVRTSANALMFAIYIFLFIWSVSFIILGAHNPFIYFHF